MRDSIDLYEKTKQRISTIKNERLDADRKKHLYNVLDIWKYESSSDYRVISITELFRKAEIHGIYESDYSNSIRTGFCILMKESGTFKRYTQEPEYGIILDNVFFESLDHVMKNNKLAWRESWRKHIQEELKKWRHS